MSTAKPRHISLPHRTFGEQGDSALASDTPDSTAARVSFDQGARWRNVASEEEGVSPGATERPPIPSALPPSGEALSTPLPVIPMIVLSITMLGEFLSANVSTPFLLFMVEDFGAFHEEGDVGYWTGILVSSFFITQFLTSLLWATAAERHGARAVLFVSLLGSSLTCSVFGTATSLKQAIVVRLLQGIFAGAIGVGRGTVVTITDPSNEGRAYSILGFCWGFGGVAGAIIGGTFESAAIKWPAVFARVPLFVKYPYLLPCVIASTFTFSGAIMSLFLAYDGGPRDGAIRLPLEKITIEETIPEEPTTPLFEEAEPIGVVSQLKKKVSMKFSGYFAHRVHGSPGGSTPPMPLSTSAPRSGKLRTFSKTSRASGSAYGYSGGFRHRLASNVSQTLAGRRGSLASTVARRRGSTVGGPEAPADGGEPNFAQRLLMANEFAVTNIADLWVAAAMNVDNEDPFESDTDAVFDDDDADPFTDDADADAGLLRPGVASSSRPAPVPRLFISHRQSAASVRPQFGVRRASAAHAAHLPAGALSPPQGIPRRPSTTAPGIFAHVGVRTPPAAHEPLQPLPGDAAGDGEGLASIVEDRHPPPPRLRAEPVTEPSSGPGTQPILQLPILIIIQYGLLALHSTTHDQVFLSYLVSKYDSGGLNLNAGHFAQLIALMCLAQIAYQFYLYPNMGPPRGRFSHLAMFRIGSLLFIPSYLTVTLYHPLASANDDGNLLLMAALAVSNAMRYCGITFAYTAIAILLNYMSPPHLLGLANGMAQSIVSLSRFIGPILGGLLWSVSVEGNPSGYPLGFIVCSGITAVAVLTSFFIR